ncbi:MAG: hypothetical protein ACWGQW_14955 [bacterium]
MKKIKALIAKEIREVLPAFVFFLFLFHMIALTKAVTLHNYSFTALRAAASTVGALIVAKAILLVEALPVAKLFSRRKVVQIVWKTLLYASVALVFRFIEEMLPLISKYGDTRAASKAILDEISWPLFGVFALWILGGLLLYCLVSEVVRVAGLERVKEMLFHSDIWGSEQ